MVHKGASKQMNFESTESYPCRQEQADQERFENMQLPSQQQQIVYVPVPVATAMPTIHLPFTSMIPIVHTSTPNYSHSQFNFPQIQLATDSVSPKYQTGSKSAQQMLMTYNNTNYFDSNHQYGQTDLMKLQEQQQLQQVLAAQEGHHDNHCENCGHINKH